VRALALLALLLAACTTPAATPLEELAPTGAVAPLPAPRGSLFVLVEGPEGNVDRRTPPEWISAAEYAQVLRGAIVSANLFTLADRFEDADYALTVLDVRCYRRMDIEKGYVTDPLWQLAHVATGEARLQARIASEVDARADPGSGAKQKAAAIRRLFRSNLERGLRALEEASRPPG
jgi:hypothetical protein